MRVWMPDGYKIPPHTHPKPERVTVISGATIIQLHGTGPWSIEYVDPADDPRNAKK